MEVKVIEGDLFTSTSQTLVNTTNCVGVMGKGIALEFKNRSPNMFKDYRARYLDDSLKIGEPYVYKGLLKPWIMNFPTKIDWRRKSEIDWIIDGLQYVVDHYKEWGITSLACPMLGCDNGKLNPDEIYPLMKRYFEQLDIQVEVFVRNRHRRFCGHIDLKAVDEVRQ